MRAASAPSASGSMVPGTRGTPMRWATRRAATLSPMARTAAGGGPMYTSPAVAQASEKTATVLMPSSRQARITRTAISPRLAMRTFEKGGVTSGNHSRHATTGQRDRPLFRGLREHLEEQALHRRCVPVARAHDPREESPLSVDHIHAGRPEHTVPRPRHLAAPIDEHGRDVATLGRRAFHMGGILTEADQPYLEPLALELLVEAIDGRQLLPAIRSPRGPEEQQHHLPAQILEPRHLAVGIGQGEVRGRLGRIVSLGLEGGPLRSGGGRLRREQQDAGHRRPAHHAAFESLRAWSTSSALSRSSGLSMILMYFTVPVLSMMKYARLA